MLLLMFLIKSIKNDKKTLQNIDKNNSKIMAIIINSVNESIYKNIEDLESAYDMINKLEEKNQKADEFIIESW